MYKIFFSSRCLVLSECVENAMSLGELSAMHKYSTPNELRQFVDKFATNSKLLLGCVYFHNLDALWQQFSQLFHQITAAGGLIQNAEGKYLVINRLGVPDLPKGKSEKGETPEATAVREVMEETGLQSVEIVSPIGKIYHTYPIDGQLALKTTHWYLMTTNSNQPLKPQTEENITAAQWLTATELKAEKEKSYASLREIFDFVE